MHRATLSSVVLLSAFVLGCGQRPADRPSAETAANTSAVDSAGATAASAPVPVPDRWQLTEEGLGPLHVGMTAEEVRATVAGDFYIDGRSLIILAVAPRDTMFRFVFETDRSRVTTMRAGRYPAVEWVEGCA